MAGVGQKKVFTVVFFTILLNHTLSLSMFIHVSLSLYQSFPMYNALGAAVEKDTYVSANAIWINGGI